jgi:Flp pilus assembly protein TadG
MPCRQSPADAAHARTTASSADDPKAKAKSGARISHILADRRGSISIIAALSFVAVIGMAALAVDYGRVLMQRSENQRIADLAAYGGALVYNATSSTDDATAAANNIASLNGLSDASSTVVASPTGDGNDAMHVNITSDVPLYLARVLTANTTLSVGAAASAEMKSGSPGCIIALSGSGTGVTVGNSTGGAATITADNCAVASNAAVTAANASTITTKVIDYGTSHAASGASKMVTPSGGTPTFSKRTTTDPLSGNSGVAAATAHLGFDALGNCLGTAGTVCALASPSAPSGISGGSALTLNLLSKTGGLPTGCTTSSTKSPWAINCSGTGPIQFGSLTIGGSTTATVTGTSSGATYTFNGLISATSSGSLTFNGGSGATYKIGGGIVIGGASTVNFGAGTFLIGAGAGSCNGATNYSICNGNSGSGTTSFAGPSSFTLTGGIYNGGSSRLTLGSGSTSNSYDLGAASDGYSIYANIASVTLNDATGAGGVFQTAGSISTAGSSTLTIPAATQHDIHGNVLVASSSTADFGAGTYTVTGYVSVGGSAGAATLDGDAASGVTLVIGGAGTPASGTCSGLAFCAAQASSITIVAPSSGTMDDLAVIGPTLSGNHAGALISAAGSSSLSGAVYFPNGPGTVSSASGLGGGSGQCLELIGSQITVTGASAIGTTCTGLGGSGAGAGGAVALVQ